MALNDYRNHLQRPEPLDQPNIISLEHVSPRKKA